jgi:hypothetical protein
LAAERAPVASGSLFKIAQSERKIPALFKLTHYQDLTALEFISFGAHIGSEYGGAQHASNRANSGRQDVLLSSLWSTLFGDVFAAFQE